MQLAEAEAKAETAALPRPVVTAVMVGVALEVVFVLRPALRLKTLISIIRSFSTKRPAARAAQEGMLVQAEDPRVQQVH
jgi:hypothetical protein